MPLDVPVNPDLFLPNYLKDKTASHFYRRVKLPLIVHFVKDQHYTRVRQGIALQALSQWLEPMHHPLFTYTLTENAAEADTVVTFSPKLPIGYWGETAYDYHTYDQVIHKAYITLIVDSEETPARLQSTTVHEFGHALGMNVHTRDCQDAMKGDFYCGFPETIPPLSERDINSLKTAYSWLFSQ